MLGFDPLTLSSLMVLASAGGHQCALPKPTKINVIPKSAEIKYDYGQTLAALRGQKTDTIDPSGFGGVSILNGYAESPIAMKPEVKIEYKGVPGQDAACLWYDQIDIHINITPKITIAKEVYFDKCQKAAVLEHEMKHVMETRRVVNKYASTMAKKVYAALKSRGFSVGPVPGDQAQTVFDRMHDTVYKIVDFEFKKMELDHHERQLGIDSKEEYEAVAAKCPDFDAQGYALKGQAKR